MDEILIRLAIVAFIAIFIGLSWKQEAVRRTVSRHVSSVAEHRRKSRAVTTVRVERPGARKQHR